MKPLLFFLSYTGENSGASIRTCAGLSSLPRKHIAIYALEAWQIGRAGVEEPPRWMAFPLVSECLPAVRPRQENILPRVITLH